MALNCINLHQKGFGSRGAAPDPAGGLGGPMDPRLGSMAMYIFATTSLHCTLLSLFVMLLFVLLLLLYVTFIFLYTFVTSFS